MSWDDTNPFEPVDLADVYGHAAGRRALEVAATGRHPVLLIGPRGCGKTLLARCLPGLLPAATAEEVSEVQGAYERTAESPPDDRPVRAPRMALRPREVAREAELARHGVLLLDDLPAYRRPTLRALGQALDRERDQHNRPAILATMRACPCGRFGVPLQECICQRAERRRYWRRLAETVLDRFEICCYLEAVHLAEMGHYRTRRRDEGSAAVVERVERRRAIQRARVEAGEPEQPVEERLDAPTRRLVEAAKDRLGLSTRELLQARRVARTVADLAGSEAVRAPYLAEALQYRLQDTGRITAS